MLNLWSVLEVMDDTGGVYTGDGISAAGVGAGFHTGSEVGGMYGTGGGSERMDDEDEIKGLEIVVLEVDVLKYGVLKDDMLGVDMLLVDMLEDDVKELDDELS